MPWAPSLGSLAEWADCGAHLGPIGVAPIDFFVGEEIAAAHLEIDVRVVDTGRDHAVLVESAGGAQQAPANAGDHKIARPQILEAVVGDPAHALGHRLVLAVDTGDAGIDLSALLRRAVDHPVVRRVLREPPSTVP